MMMKQTLFCLAASFCATQVAAGDPIDDAVSHRILPGWTQADGTQMAALELALAPGWKTYWRSPGDAGIPPHFNWQGAKNLQDVHVHWPSPSVFWQSGMRSVGYTDRVILPFTVAPKKDGQDVHLKGRVLIGICSDICVPVTLDIDAELPANSTKRSPAIIAALANLPFSAGDAGVVSAKCQIRPTDDGMAVKATITMPSSGGTEEAVIEPPEDGVWVSDAKTERNGNTLTVSADMIHTSGAAFSINRSDIRITVIGGSHSVDIQGCTGS